MRTTMNGHTEWLSHFVRWFFNASPGWVDEDFPEGGSDDVPSRPSAFDAYGGYRVLPRPNERPIERRSEWR
jgi:hypothetical protein